MSSISYVSLFASYSSWLIVLVYPITCAASVPDEYVLTASVEIFTPGNSLFLSLICATTSLLTSSAIVIDFVALYPVVVILYLIDIIFLASCALSVVISYFSLNSSNASVGLAFSSILYVFFHFANSSSFIVNSYGSILIGKVSVKDIWYSLSKFTNFNIAWFNSSSPTFVLNNSILFCALTPASSFPDLSKIDPLAASIEIILDNLVFDCSL